jgi:uncharacterized SAM-binding protein YcdF (DUF218 family)
MPWAKYNACGKLRTQPPLWKRESIFDRSIPILIPDSGPQQPKKPVTEPRTRWRLAAEGFVLGALSGVLASLLGISGLVHINDLFLLWGLLGSGLAMTRGRLVLHLLAASLLVTGAIVGYTPLAARLMHGLIRSDPLQHADAIVVLSSMTQSDGSLSAHASERAMQGYFLLRQGYGSRLVMSDATVPFGSQIPRVRKEMAMLRMDYPIESSGPAADTHDEAVGTARLARRYGWKRVILVTQPWHMRRAAAVFTKAGVAVVCSPCTEGTIDMNALTTPAGRLEAFRYWLHETIGYEVYRRRGWIE